MPTNFNLKGVEDGCVPITKYFSADIQVGGRLVHDIGILIKKDNIPLTDSKGRSTRPPAILGCNLIRKGLELRCNWTPPYMDPSVDMKAGGQGH